MGCGASVPKRKISVSDNGLAQQLPKHLLLGVSPQFIRTFCASHGVDDETTAEEIGEVVAEVLGDEAQVSLAEASREFVGGDGKQRTLRTANGRPAVAKATLFVVHAHSCLFLRLLEALDSYLELHGLAAENQYLWIDCFSTRRALVDPVAAVRHTAEIVPRVGRVVITCDPWNSPVALTRLWCLHELVAAQASEAVVHLAMTMADRRTFIHALQTKRRTIEADLSHVDARTAATSHDADRDALHAALRSRRRGSLGGAMSGRKSSQGSNASTGDDEAAFDAFNELARAAMMQAIQAFAWKQDL
mmetsp:Transcript_8511/g.21985  ORF Transcript_8511/g.21985 Transcript_8511/m.21985 type:complete len:304 (+) Transcript_8511:69-980(+)